MIEAVSFFGSSRGAPGELAYNEMKSLGRLLGHKGIQVWTGAYSGSGMEAPAAGCKDAGGKTRGFSLGLPDVEVNRFIDDAVDCFRHSGNNPAKALAIRTGFLLEADGIVVGPIGPEGSIGTLSEVMTLLAGEMKGLWPGKSVVFFEPAGVMRTSWHEVLVGLYAHGIVSKNEASFVEGRTASTAEEALDLLLQQ